MGREQGMNEAAAAARQNEGQSTARPFSKKLAKSQERLTRQQAEQQKFAETAGVVREARQKMGQESANQPVNDVFAGKNAEMARQKAKAKREKGMMQTKTVNGKEVSYMPPKVEKPKKGSKSGTQSKTRNAAADKRAKIAKIKARNGES